MHRSSLLPLLGALIASLSGGTATFAQTPCVNGLAGGYPCNNVDLLAHMTLAQLGARWDLDRVRAKGDYLSLLGGSTRSQIRRAQRKSGRLELDVASTLPEAIAIYDEMSAFHGRYWRSRGEFGVFADPWFDRFHRTLIERRFAHGEIQLLRLRSDGVSVGCLYNFVANGHVAFYQSGLNHIPERDLKPGYQSHVAAVEYAAKQGLAIYDFLGDARYKQNLGTDASEMVWARVQKKRARFALEDHLRRFAAARTGARAPTG